MKKGLFPVLLAAGLFLAAISVLSLAAGPKIYWHFTVKAFVDLPNRDACEWAWVTMVELDRTRAFPDEAQTVRDHGGELKGTVFAFIRGAAWRSAYSYQRDNYCHGKKDKQTISWEQSDSDEAYAEGGFYSSVPSRDGSGHNALYPDMFSFGFTNRTIIHEDGSREDLKARARVAVGAINVAGRPAEETRGSFPLRCVTYRDELEHHVSCEKRWVEQFVTRLRSLHVRCEIPRLDEPVFLQQSFGPHDRNLFVWEVHRTRNGEHPHWKQQTM
jgi:hypothetical protein